MTENPWENKRTYKLFGKVIYAIKAKKDDLVGYYTEIHDKETYQNSGTRYIASHGSNMPTMLLAVIETYIKKHNG